MFLDDARVRGVVQGRKSTRSAGRRTRGGYWDRDALEMLAGKESNCRLLDETIEAAILIIFLSRTFPTPNIGAAGPNFEQVVHSGKIMMSPTRQDSAKRTGCVGLAGAYEGRSRNLYELNRNMLWASGR